MKIIDFEQKEKQRTERTAVYRCDFSIGAELQNLLKLFGALVDGRLSSAPNVPAALEGKELVIY